MTDHEKIDDCIEQIKDYAEDSIPVLTGEKELIGVITSQDLVEVVDDAMGEDYAKLAGLTAEEDLEETTKRKYEKETSLVDDSSGTRSWSIFCGGYL